MSETKICEQCHAEKAINQFRKVGNMYTPFHHMSICKSCYKQNQEERQRQYEVVLQEQRRQEEAAREAERQVREQEEQRRQARAIELSIQANERCPRCKQVRTDGQLWGDDDRVHFTRFCKTCIEATPHSIYTLTCPLDGLVRYVGITSRSLKQRLSQHMNDGAGTEQKNAWIEMLKGQRIRALIEKIDEASNESEAQGKEQEWIDHYLANGCPLTNAEALDPQRVLDVQSGRIPPEQETFLSLEESHLSASSFRRHGDQESYWRIIRWSNRHEHAYVATGYRYLFERSETQSYACQEKEKSYSLVSDEPTLPKGKAARRAILDTITIAFFRWGEAYPLTECFL